MMKPFLSRRAFSNQCSCCGEEVGGSATGKACTPSPELCPRAPEGPSGWAERTPGRVKFSALLDHPMHVEQEEPLSWKEPGSGGAEDAPRGAPAASRAEAPAPFCLLLTMRGIQCWTFPQQPEAQGWQGWGGWGRNLVLPQFLLGTLYSHSRGREMSRRE